MKIAGIIAEYNPFHNGHLLQIEATRAAGAGAIVAVMGGNWLQRGAPALCRKQARARAALLSGVDLVLGTVVPDEPRDSPAHRMWWSQHDLSEGHGAVHGANLGVRLDRLMDVGGFPDNAVDEDVLTVQRLKSAGVRWLATDTTRVTTSARRTGRIPNGFAAYMRSLDDLVSSEQTAQL